MSWVTLTELCFSSSLNQVEETIYRSFEAANDTADGDRLPDILSQVVAEVRGYIASCDRNDLSVREDVIPEAFKHHAIAIARYRLLSSLPRCEVTEARTKEFEEANKFFLNVACCKIRPEAAEDARSNEAADLEIPRSAQVIHSRCQVTGRRNLSGL